MDENQRAMEQAQYDAVVNAIAAAQSDSAARWQYQQAMHTGDFAAAGEAQERISRAQAQLVSLESGRQAMDDNQQGYHQQPQQQRQYTPQEIINGMTQLTAEERQWLMDRPHLVARPETITQLQAAFYESQQRGIQRNSPEYFALFNERLGGAGVPGSRASNIQLTAAQKDAAKIAGISESEYQKQYNKMIEQQHDTRSLYGKFVK
jgi:hypothetical protein